VAAGIRWPSNDVVGGQGVGTLRPCLTQVFPGFHQKGMMRVSSLIMVFCERLLALVWLLETHL